MPKAVRKNEIVKLTYYATGGYRAEMSGGTLDAGIVMLFYGMEAEARGALIKTLTQKHVDLLAKEAAHVQLPE